MSPAIAWRVLLGGVGGKRVPSAKSPVRKIAVA
jgi:hypothetical protein